MYSPLNSDEFPLKYIFILNYQLIVFWFQFDEGRNDFEEEYSVETIKKFIATQGLPSVVEFNHETAQKIFGGDIKSHLLLFLSKKAGHYDTHVKAAEKVAPQFKGQVGSFYLPFVCNNIEAHRWSLCSMGCFCFAASKSLSLLCQIRSYE